VKVAARRDKTHNPSGEVCWVSRLRENFTSGSDGEGLETGSRNTLNGHERGNPGYSQGCSYGLPRQSFTRQLFFKWIKQHLRIKRFFGTSENAVKSQIWIAISVYVLIAIVKKRLNLNVSLHMFLQILSVTIFEKIELTQAVTNSAFNKNQPMFDNQLNLFDS
jgi:hypothetical protein